MFAVRLIERGLMVHICKPVGLHNDCSNAAPWLPKQRVLSLGFTCIQEPTLEFENTLWYPSLQSLCLTG